MEMSTPRIADLIVKRIRHEVNNWVRALQQGANALGDYSSRIAHQLEYTSNSWTRANDEIQQILSDNELLTFAQVDRLLALMPPDRAILRFHLERLTTVYREICQGPRDEIGRLMIQAETAIDGGDFEVGLNVLDTLQKQEPHFFPALLLKGVTLMRSEHGRAESTRLFETAIQAAPNRASARFQQLAMELLAATYQLGGQPSGAIKTLKRIRTLGVEDPAVEYSIARNTAIHGQPNDAMNVLLQAIAGRHELVSLALIDKDFSPIRKLVMQHLEEANEEWGERAVKLLKRAEEAATIARQYRLDKRDRSISRGLTTLRQLDSYLEKGCFSVYRMILASRLPRWLETVLPAIDGHFQAEIQDQRDRIERHNADVLDAYNRRRNRFMGVGIPLWTLFSAIVFLLALSNGSGTIAGLLASGVTLGIGALPFFLVNNLLKRGMESKLVDPDESASGREESKRLREISSSIVSELRENGIEVNEKKVLT